MLNKTRLTFILGVIVCGAATVTSADTIRLMSGQTIEGTIVERANDEIKVDTGIGVLITYYVDEIQDISSGASDPSPAPEITAEDSQDISKSMEGHKGTEIIQIHPLNTVETAPAVSDSPILSSTNLEAGSREEHFLLQRYQKSIDEKARTETDATPSSKPLGREEYLEKQVNEKQAILKKGIAKGVRIAGQKLTQGFKTIFKDKTGNNESLKIKSLPPYFPTLFIGIMIGFYVLVCYPCMVIARKLGLAGWMAWVPIIQIFLLFKMAGRPWWWVMLLLVPVINCLIPIILWMDIAKRFNKSTFWGILMIVPVLNLVIPWYLAFAAAEE